MEDSRYFNIEHFPTAKAAAAEGVFSPPSTTELITTKEVSTILDYSLALSVMRSATELEINDVFDRINTYGHRLSDQERRQAGVQNEFSTLVRELACTLRGDTSADILTLQSMPSISIDLPMASHGYEVRADEVFWVNQGILRLTDLAIALTNNASPILRAVLSVGSGGAARVARHAHAVRLDAGSRRGGVRFRRQIGNICSLRVLPVLTLSRQYAR